MNRDMRKDLSQDKKMVAKGVHKHEKALHPGKPLTPMKSGGKVGDTTMKMDKKRPVTPSGAPMKKGGRACMADGGRAGANLGPVRSTPKPLAPPTTSPTQSMHSVGGRNKFAAGGVAKIRHNQATKAGKPTAGAQKKFGNLI